MAIKSPGRHVFLPGAKVGAHCFSKVPWLFVDGAAGSEILLRLIPASSPVNHSMPLLDAKLARLDVTSSDEKVVVLVYQYLDEP